MFRKDVLPNGIRVVSESVSGVRSVSIGVWVCVGSRHEPKEINGVSHFIEHLFFKGTKRRSAQQIAIEVDSIGGEMNAFTSREGTTYYIKVLDEHIPLGIDLLSDILLNSSFEPKDIETERKVILEEIKMVEDTPDDMIHDLFTQSVWPDNPLGCSVLGTRENIRSINRAAIVGHVDKYYNAPEIVISVTGHFEHDPLIDLLTRHFGGLTKNGGRPETSSPSFRPGLYIKRKELEQVQICLGTSGLPQSDEDRYALYALNAILGSSMSSRLFQEIREDRGLVYSIYSYVTSFQDAGLFVVYAGCDGSNAAEVVRLIMASLADIKAKGVTEAELKRAKDQMKGNLMLSVESTSNRMSQLAKQEIYFGRHFSLQNILDDMDRVEAGRVHALANKLFAPGQIGLSVLGPVSKKEFPDDVLVC
jgi:predicted Zn-dependent peptidase